MSLLLDALKRSEKARQEREEREGKRSPEGPEETREFSLEALEEGKRELREASGEQSLPRAERPRVAETAAHSAVRAPVPPAGGDEAERRRLVEDTAEGHPDLEIIEPDPDDTSYDSQEMRADPARADTGSVERPVFSLLDDSPPPDKVSDTNTSGAMPDAEQARASVDSYFDGTQSMSVSRREVHGAIGEEAEGSTGERASTGARNSTTQRRARTVVEARTAGRARGRSGAWLWVPVVLVFALFAAGGGWYYLNFIDSGPALFAGGTPPAPRPRPVTPEPAAVDVPAVTEAAPTAPAPVQEPATQTLAEVDLPDLADLPEPPVRGDLAPGAEPAAAEPPRSIDLPAPPVEEVLTEPEPGPEPEPTQTAGPVTPEGVSERLARAIRAAGVQGQGSSGISIARTPRRDTVSPALGSAFEAFQRGDDLTARQAYESVLAREPANRDALLGLAAVSMRAGDAQRAGELYLRVLRTHPQDRIARASVIALSDRLDPVEAESRIRNLIDDDPDSPHLRFLLGNVYAAAQRWSLAQEAYFQAYRLDRANPDYAYNLAVSLDHLSQPRSALDYYQRALELSDARSAGFEPAAVMNRIRVMTADAGGQ